MWTIFAVNNMVQLATQLMHQFLHQTFDGHFIKRNCDINWPPGNWYLTTLDNFLSGCRKSEAIKYSLCWYQRCLVSTMWCNMPHILCQIDSLCQNSDVNWQPRSLDLTHLSYFLWRAVKEQCYGKKTETIKHLKANVCDTIAKIWAHTLEKVYANWSDRMRYCEASHGGCMSLQTFWQDCYLEMTDFIWKFSGMWTFALCVISQRRPTTSGSVDYIFEWHEYFTIHFYLQPLVVTTFHCKN